MSERKYTKAVEKELIQAVRTAAERESEERIKNIADFTRRWENGQLDVNEALDNIQRLVNLQPVSWLSEADPGVPVAHGVSMGLISQKDLSPAAWKAIEVLVTVAEI